jgi:hypothetical protein
LLGLIFNGRLNKFDMQELLHYAVEPVNIVFTGLLIIVIMYWISVMIGALDLSSFDVEFDADVDADIDVDVDTDADMDGPDSAGWLSAFGQFLNLGKIPFMVIISILVMTLWALELLSNYYLGNSQLGFMLALLIPTIFVSMVITKILTTPLVQLFEKLDAGGAAPIDYIGMECTVRLSADPGELSQAEVILDGNPLTINVKNPQPRPLLKGHKAIITKVSADEKFFFVRPIDEASNF